MDLPSTDWGMAAALAERVRVGVERQAWFTCAVTAPNGVTALQSEGTGGTDLIFRADEALYRFKATGRSLVTCTPTLAVGDGLADVGKGTS